MYWNTQCIQLHVCQSMNNRIFQLLKVLKVFKGSLSINVSIKERKCQVNPIIDNGPGSKQSPRQAETKFINLITGEHHIYRCKANISISRNHEDKYAPKKETRKNEIYNLL